MGQGQEDQVEAVGQTRVVRLEAGSWVGGRQARVEVSYLRARLGLAHGPHQLELRVLERQPQQFGPGVARGPDDAHSIHGGASYGSLNNHAKRLDDRFGHTRDDWPGELGDDARMFGWRF